MIRTSLLAAAAGVALLLAGTGAAQAAPPAYVAAAIADPARPAEDVARDANRRPAEMVEFAGIKPGDRIVEFIPAAGYFTRIFARVTGPTGHVHLFVPAAVEGLYNFGADARKLAAAYPNVSADIVAPADFKPEPADVFWTSQNYHDLAPGTAGGFNKRVFNLLKPGGVYIVLDHAAAAGSGARDGQTLHRIDPATVKAEVIAAGFQYVGETTVLANPADAHDKVVYDPSVRGKTDQFVYKFRKPG
jgi:predicted methyltransferase